jgi:hypothetical protein
MLNNTLTRFRNKECSEFEPRLVQVMPLHVHVENHRSEDRRVAEGGTHAM